MTRPLAAFEAADPVAAVGARIPTRAGTCAQVRSLPSRDDAEAVAARIRAEESLPVELLVADLGPRGTWYRLCVGSEESSARIVARATRWTAPGGALERFLDPPVGNEPRFLVHERSVADPRTATAPQARALLERTAAPRLPASATTDATSPTPTDAASAGPAPSTSTARMPIVTATHHPDADVAWAGTPARPVVVGTGPAPGGGTRVIAVDVDGRVLPLDGAPPPGCASCVVAEQKSPLVARRLIATGDLLPAPGAEIVVEEETRDGTRFLSVLVDEGGTLRRRGAVLLAQSTPDVTLRGEAAVVEGDGDDDREIAVSRLELRFSGGNLCSLSTRAEVWATDADAARGLVRVDVMGLAQRERGDDAVVDHITALDGAGDRDAASRACARVLAARPSTLVTQLCLQRVRTLVADHHLVDAVNAAGTLSEGVPTLRAAVAGPFFAAMSALDADPRLSAAPWDCAESPLVAGVAATTTTTTTVDAGPGGAALPAPLPDVRALPATAAASFGQTLALARARLAERVGLADIVDATFVTAARDFGVDTPVGQLASRWLERLRAAQPARHAALEALLLPVADPPPTPSSSSPAPAASATPAPKPAPMATTTTTTRSPAAPRLTPHVVAPDPAPGDEAAFGGTP